MITSKKTFRYTLLAALSLLGFAFMVALALPVYAATITVNTTTDEFGAGAGCALREAIQAANTNAAFGGCAAGTAGADIIQVPAGIYTLTRTGSNEDQNAMGDLDVVTDTAGVMILGTGATSATVVIAGSGDRVLHAPSAPLTLSNLTLRGGSGVSYGGGAYFGGAATVTGTTFSGNAAWSYGGGADFSGVTTISGATFSANTAGSDGGGASFSGITTITGTTFSGNTADRDGGGANFTGVAIVTGTTFASNTASSGGGGAWFFNAATVTGTTFSGNRANTGAGGGAWFISASVTGTTFSANTAGSGGGGGYFTSIATVAGTTFSANTAGSGGGGAYFFSTTTLTGTTFTNNTAGSGGGAYFTGGNAKRLVNVLFARNRASTSGAAIYVANANPLQLFHTTIVSPTVPTNAPQALYVLQGTVHLTNTLIATHTVGIGNGGGTVREWHGMHSAVTTPYTGSIIASGSLTGAAAFYDTTNYQLTANSLAVDAGINANVNRDFFGNPRPQGRAPDVGYAESPFAPALTFALTAQPTHLIANGLDEAVLTVTATLTNGVPLSGQPITLTTPLGTVPNPVLVLGANGVSTTTYTAGVIPGTTPLTATLNDLGSLQVATTVVTLKPNPLIGSLGAQFGGQTITYTFAVTNVVTTTQTVVMSGSVPVGGNLIAVSGGTGVPTGGDYGAGYAEATNIVLAPNASYTLQWTVQFVGFTGNVVTQGHAESTLARLRLPVVLLIYRQLIMPVYGKP